jgi:hypothetical protein
MRLHQWHEVSIRVTTSAMSTLPKLLQSACHRLICFLEALFASAPFALAWAEALAPALLAFFVTGQLVRAETRSPAHLAWTPLPLVLADVSWS